MKDPTAWKDDLTFYMSDENVAGTAATLEPTLVFSGSKAAMGAWIGFAGILAGGFGGVTISPAIRERVAFVGYLVAAALLLRGLYPLTVRLLGKGAGWLAMFAFFWAAWLGFFVVLGARIDARLFGYSVSVALGAFIGMMYGAFPPAAVRNGDVWMVSFLLAPFGAFVSTYLLRHTPGAADTAVGALAGGALAGGLLTVPMGIILVRLWDEGRGLAEMGVLLLHNDNFAAKAVAHFDRAISIEPGNARYHSLRAVGLCRMNEPARAAADWDRAFTLAPDDPEPHFHRGVELLRRGDISEAIASLETALAKNPEMAPVHRHLGVAYDRQGDTTRAFEHYDHAIALAPDDAGARADRAAAYLGRGDYGQALRDADRAIRLDAQLSAAYVTRGYILVKLGRLEEARTSFENAIELEPEPSMHEAALHGLESLGRDTDEPAR